ncbi:lantibiotic dehydratase [Kitasatospora sp. SUK 42]|uniref:lantibiotic dehydratase n=1 Tax=Kitasatospora sp. SUK 42 TaxID=1588882 RepID=UPI0018CB3AB1|nr:lantibiotic dehydratase [Kitasatospora sp. SUK 42]MBV2156707.1 lantibiotic dehydratase [Kitasatospora sp. SUK 42]
MKPLYRGVEFGLLRAPVLPCDGAHAGGGSVEELFANQAGVREALLAAGGSAGGLLDQDPDRLSTKRRLRRELTLTRYLVRMSTRPTPFGLFSGVAPVRFGGGGRVVWAGRHRKAVRPDMGWLRGVTAVLEQRPAVLSSLRVGLNDLCFRRGGRLVLPYLPVTGAESVDADRRGKELSLGITQVVEGVLALLSAPVAATDLQSAILEMVPTASEEAALELLSALVGQGVLVTDLHPPLNVGDPLGHVLARLPRDGVAEVAELVKCRDGLESFGQCEVGEGAAAWRGVTERMGALHAAAHEVQVDLALGVDVELPRVVVGEVERAATVLWRASPKEEPEPMREYRTRFLERYGSDGLVPLGELLDPDIGMGPLGWSASSTRTDGRARDRILGKLVGDALAGGRREVVLDEAVVDLLFSACPEKPDAAPPAVDVYATLLAGSVSELAKGDFQLVLDSCPWGRVAGATMGRFSHVLPDMEAGLDKVAACVAEVVPHAAGLSWQVRDPRYENVARVPVRHRVHVNVGSFPGPADARTLDVGDIAVGADSHGFRLFSLSLGQEIRPMHGHQLIWTSAPQPAQFLVQAFWSRVRGWPMWEWGALDVLPFLPRVRYGRSVLSCARWQLDKDLSRAFGSGGRREWLEAFDAWRVAHHVPDVVAVGHDDQRLSLNLKVSSQRDVLWDEIIRGGHDTLHEVPGGLDPMAHGWLNGPDGPHVGQVVFPLVLAKPPAQDHVHPLPVGSPGRTVPRMPGGDWLYAKIYGSAARQTEILTQRLPELLKAVDEHVERWFFLRYADPEPHLRIRFHGTPSTLNRHVLPLLHDWTADLHSAGLARRLVLDTYTPETERYGDPGTLPLAEDVFHADSLAVLHQLITTNDTPLEVVTAAHCIDIARHAHHPDDWADWFLRTYPRSVPGLRHDDTHITVADFITFDPPGPGPRIQRTPHLAQAWAQRGIAITRYAGQLRCRPDPLANRHGWACRLESVLHMHCNRMLGSRRLEEKAYVTARNAVQARLARQTAGQETP